MHIDINIDKEKCIVGEKTKREKSNKMPTVDEIRQKYERRKEKRIRGSECSVGFIKTKIKTFYSPLREVCE